MIARLREWPALGVGGFTLCWALVEIIGPAAGVSPYQVVWTRYGVHLLVLALLLARRRGLDLVRTRQPAREVASSLLMLGMPLCFVLAAHRMPLQDTMGVFWTAPLLVVAAGAALGQPFGGRRTVLAAVVGLVGALLIVKPDAGLLRPAVVFALGMAACFAMYVVLVSTIRRDALGTKLFHTALWVFAALTLALPRFWHTPTLRGMAAMVAIGVLGLIGLWMLDGAIEMATPATLAPVLYTQLAWDASLHVVRHWLKGGPLPDHATLAGTALVVAAAVPALMMRARHADLPARATARERSA